MGAVFFGNGLSGIACNLLRAITLLAFPVDLDDPTTFINNFYGACTFLTIGAIMLGSCIMVQLFILRKNKFYIYYLDWVAAEKDRSNNLDAEQEAFDYGLANTRPVDLTIGS